MRVPLRTALYIASILALTAFPAIETRAQSSPGSFTLPEPTPTPTSRPEVEGPVDDTGVVPVAPRVIPTETPTPAPTVPLPTPTGAATPPPRITPQPTLTPEPGPALPDRNTSPTPERATPVPAERIVPAGTPDAASPESPAPPAGGSGTTAGDTIPGLDPDATIASPPVVEPPGEGSNEQAMLPWWLWIALPFGIGLLGLGIWLVARRRELPVPEIERPQVANNEAPLVPADLQLDLTLDITAAQRSVMLFMVDYRLTIDNRSDRAVRDLEVSTILTCAQGAIGKAEGDLAFDRPDPIRIARIGPNQCETLRGQVQLPNAKLAAIYQGKKPLFVPLLQVTVTPNAGEPLTRHYVLGLPSTASAQRVHPIPFDTPVGGLQGLRARELDMQPA